MPIKRKTDLQSEVFEGISSVLIVKNGITITDNAATIAETDVMEFPVSDDSGFNFDTGEPSIEHFKVKGLSTDWVNTFTPGESEITLEIPCIDTDIIEWCFGRTGVTASITLPSGLTVNGKTNLSGKCYASDWRSVYFGMLVLNDTEDRVMFIKKAKFNAQVQFDGSEKPLCVVLKGAIANAADPNAFGILTPVDAVGS